MGILGRLRQLLELLIDGLDALEDNLALRPRWMNALMFFCAYMTFVYMPFDMLFKPVAEDREVWFGLLFSGWAAKATEPLHWFVYGAGLRGFWLMRRWMHPWAALYVAQVAFSMGVWPLQVGRDPIWGLVAALPFVALAVALWRAREQFQGDAAASSEPKLDSATASEAAEARVGPKAEAESASRSDA